MLLQIDGWYGAGKSVLLGLLDGHPSISPNPLHDATHMLALLDKSIISCDYHDIEEIRRLLGYTQYYIFEKSSRLGYGNVSFGSGIEVKPSYDFDFYEFDKAWVTELEKYQKWSPELIIDVIYKNYAFYLTGKHDWKYNPSMSWPIISSQQRFMENFKLAKSIYVERPIEQIIAVRSGRKKIENTNDSFFAPGFDKLIKENEVKKIINYSNFINDLIEKYPERIMKIDFNDLIFDRKNSMLKVSNFLEIPFHESLLKWTFLGDEVRYEGKSYVDGVNDNPEDILSLKQREIIENKIKSSNQSINLKIVTNLFKKSANLLNRIAEKLDS